MKQAVEELEKTKQEMEKLTDLKKQLEERNNMMERELADLKANSGTAEESLAEAEAQIESLMKMKFEFEERVKVSCLSMDDSLFGNGHKQQNTSQLELII